MDTLIKPKALNDRANTKLAAAVDEALTIALEQDTQTAARFLEGQGAGFALVCRVLTEPSRRRACT